MDTKPVQLGRVSKAAYSQSKIMPIWIMAR
jgi:hypothetical protein